MSGIDESAVLGDASPVAVGMRSFSENSDLWFSDESAVLGSCILRRCRDEKLFIDFALSTCDASFPSFL